ncbi:major facilitator superfamily domain-containing protein [Dipodascopsis uninucleata]
MLITTLFSSIYSEPSFPEGGFGWFVVFSAWLIMALTYGMINAFGVYETFYVMKYPNMTSSKLSVIGSLQPCLTFLAAVPAVTVMHHIGPQLCTFIGGMIMVASFMLLSITTEAWQIYIVQGLMYGIGSGLTYVTATAVLFQWFKHKRALVMGIASSGSSLAVRRMIKSIGFAWTNRVIGFIFLPVVLAISVFLRPRLPRRGRKPGENFLMINFAVLKDARFLAMTLSFVLCCFGLFPGLFYFDLFCNRLPNLSQGVKDYNIAILNAASVFGRIIPGYAGDKLGRMNALFPLVLLSGILPLALWIPARSTAAAVCFAVFWGFSSGALVSMYPACIGHLFPIHDMQSYLSLFFAFSSISAIIGPYCSGTFIPDADASDVRGFNKLAILVGVFLLGAAVVQLAVRLSISRKIFYNV